jgi:hypothetical protein
MPHPIDFEVGKPPNKYVCELTGIQEEQPFMEGWVSLKYRCENSLTKVNITTSVRILLTPAQSNKIIREIEMVAL